MNFSPIALASAACVTTLLVSAQFVPTVEAQSPNAPEYRVQVQWEKAARTVNGLIITGCIRNTGRQPLTYTKALPVLEDGRGRTVYTGNGYLTVSPLLPGQAAEFRACEANAPTFSQWRIAFREAGCPVRVEVKGVVTTPRS